MMKITSRGGKRLAWIGVVFLTISTLTRIGLAVFSDASYGIGEWGRFLALGFFYDSLVLPCFLLPWAIYDVIMPEFSTLPRWRRAEQAWSYIWSGAYLATFLIVATAEFAFWAEFNSRFDFIAVDYLVYTHEVIGNIRESYPIALWLSIVFGICLLACIWTWPRIKGTSMTRWTWRLSRAVVAGAAVALAVTVIDMEYAEDKDNAYVQQLSLNGPYAFANAFRNNQLDYPKYYPTLAHAELDTSIRNLLRQTNVTFKGPENIDRDIAAAGPQRNINVVLISVESLSAEYMAHFGNTEGLTPNLDRLADESLFFTKFYATGTRTVRGLEALSVGTPPTPGQSIVRRPNNDNLENLGEELGEHGWEPMWIYGGYGVFDNMNAYFAANHYKVIDRTDLATEKLPIHHENIWGVADEDLYSLALLNFDRSFARGKPFFGHIMTTSNHRPYTFPENRIDLPQKLREGAVKYTDWAIGDFIRRAATKPWFKNTIFIITGDHTAKAAGRTDLPPSRYHIPLIWYAPALLPSDRFDRLMSQMDLPTTLLGWLNISYDSRFFGYDLFKLEAGRERAFISTYQKLGYLKGDRLVTLDVRKPPVVGTGIQGVKTMPPRTDAALVREAIAWYQSASEAFRSNMLKDVHAPDKPAR